MQQQMILQDKRIILSQRAKRTGKNLLSEIKTNQNLKTAFVGSIIL